PGQRRQILGSAPGYRTTTIDFTTPAIGGATLAIRLAPLAYTMEAVQVIVGSRAAHTAANELAVPVDVFPAEVLRAQGTMETASILAQVAPSVNFPRHSVSDASDVVRPFTLRGLGPDQTLVLVNGKRYHRTALVHIYGAGMGAGSSGVDMNTLPASAIDRLEVLRDGAAAQYGSDAIAGVVNVVLRRGAFGPDFTADVGQYLPDEWDPDGRTLDVAGGWGLPVGRGFVAVFGEYRDREPTNRACPDWEDQLTPGDADAVEDCRLVDKRNLVPQPTYHWGDGQQTDLLGFANALFPLTADAATQLYAFGGYAFREGVGQGYFRHGGDDRNWTGIYPLGFLPEFRPDVIDLHASAGVRGTAGGWTYDLGGTLGHNDFEYNLANTLNTSLGPCLDVPCAPGLDGVLGTADDPGIPNQTAFYAGSLRLSEAIASLDVSRAFEWGLVGPVHVAAGAAFRRETYQVEAGEPASYLQGGHPDGSGAIAPAGSQVFPGFRPENEADADRTNVGVYVDAEGDVARGVLANVAARYERYSDFGDAVTGKLALRWQPTERVTLRGALSTGFRAPSLSQSWYGSTVTNFEIGESGAPAPFDVGIFPVGSEAARALGARPLREETSRSASAGIAVTPAARLNLTADYYFIDLDDRIMLTTELGGDEVAAILASRGLQATAARYFTNAVHTRTHGVDVTAGYRLPAAGGTVDLDGIFNYTKTEIVDAIPLPPELEGTGAVLFDPFGEGGLLA
ncbi:MAG TPA: TonB-dependent receptor, partial [Longimicrobium sp.]|nr:TonB-dependent receptor [Longimicrobium sp.]